MLDIFKFYPRVRNCRILISLCKQVFMNHPITFIDQDNKTNLIPAYFTWFLELLWNNNKVYLTKYALDGFHVMYLHWFMRDSPIFWKQKMRAVNGKISISRSSLSRVVLGKGVLKICTKFTGEHPYCSAISIKSQSDFTEIALRHGSSPVNLVHVFRILFSKNTSGGLLLNIYYRNKSLANF